VVFFREAAEGSVEGVDFGAAAAAEVFVHAGVVGGGGWNEPVEQEIGVGGGGVGLQGDVHGVGDGVKFVDDVGHDVAGCRHFAEGAVGNVEQGGQGVEGAVVGDLGPEDGGDLAGVDGGQSGFGHGLDDGADAGDVGFGDVLADGGGVGDDGDFGGAGPGQPDAVDGAGADGAGPADDVGDGFGVAEAILVGADEGVVADEMADGLDGGGGVVAFDGDDDEVVAGGEAFNGGAGVDAVDVVVAPDAGDDEAVLADGVHMGGTADEGDVVAGLGHEPADGAAHGAGAHDEYTHVAAPLGCAGGYGGRRRGGFSLKKRAGAWHCRRLRAGGRRTARVRGKGLGLAPENGGITGLWGGWDLWDSVGPLGHIRSAGGSASENRLRSSANRIPGGKEPCFLRCYCEAMGIDYREEY